MTLLLRAVDAEQIKPILSGISGIWKPETGQNCNNFVRRTEGDDSSGMEVSQEPTEEVNRLLMDDFD